MRIWLDRIGVKKKNRPEGWNRPLRRTVKCLIQKHIYGVDPRETYDLGMTWRMWMYEHLKMFRREAKDVVDLEFHKFEFNGKMYTLLELIDMMIERLEFALTHEDEYFIDMHDTKYVREAEQIWSIVAPVMWW